MTDIKTFIGFFTDDQSKAAEIINFFQDRRWFDDPPEIRDGIPYAAIFGTGSHRQDQG